MAFLLILFTISVDLSKNFIISMKSASLQPLVVIAGDPRRIPEGFRGLLSPGTVFLLIANDNYVVKASILLPSVPLFVMSTTKR